MPLIEMSTEITDPRNINETNLKDYLMEILSPYSTVIPQNHQSLHIHCHRSLNIQPSTPSIFNFKKGVPMLSIVRALFSFAAPKSEIASPKIYVNVTQMQEP